MADAPSQTQFETQLSQAENSHSKWPRIGWGVFLLVIISSFIGVIGMQVSVSFILITALLLICAWRFPYFVFYLSLVGAPLLGWMVSISTGSLQFGERAFGGSIDVGVGELVAMAALAAWAFRILLLWHKRNDKEWRPWLPLISAYGILVLAHILSAFSPAEPDKLLVIKYALRPVLLAYLLSVILPVNFIRSRKRLLISLGIILLSGTFFALDGFRSLFVLGNGLYYARPLPMFGIFPIGDNHNVLAEWLMFTAPVAFAFATLTRSFRLSRASFFAGLFMVLIGLLTLARSAWITLACEILFLSLTIWRSYLKKYLTEIVWGSVAFSPLLVYMIIFSGQAEVQSSTDSRAMLAGIAWQLFRDSPIIGVGAGTFVDRVSQTWIFTYEYGAALDSHGIFQKLAAETGIVGLAAFIGVLVLLVWYLRNMWRSLSRRSPEGQAFAFLCAGVLGAFVYQVFNTTYWTAKLWLPVGIALAAGRIFVLQQKKKAPDFLYEVYD